MIWAERNDLLLRVFTAEGMISRLCLSGRNGVASSCSRVTSKPTG